MMRMQSIKFHRILALIGGIGLLVWGGSGLLHPMMAFFGPQQAVFFPPTHAVDMSRAHPVHETLSAAGIERAEAVRIIASEGRSLLQVTEYQNAPRRYFQLEDGKELENHDEAHAVFLARYYTKEEGPIRSVEWVDSFTPDYPWVNRLLPVYRVSFDRPDNLSIYVYTETNAAAGLNNNFKTVVQTGFRWFHTWSWFPKQADWARVILVSLFVGSLFALAATGLAMLVLVRRKARAPGVRGWHRLVGYVLALPILMYTSSGLFHLIQSAVSPPVQNLALSPPIDLAGAVFPLHEQWEEISAGLNVSSVSIIQDTNGAQLYRLGLARSRGPEPQGGREIRNARFDGVERTGPALYLDASTGEPYPGGDREIALQLGERFTGAPRDAILHAELVTRFGPDYDFRNKRLPVWRLDYGAPVNATIFVDTTTGVLADKTPDSAKPERFSFSYIHKWNFLVPLLGRDGQNMFVSALVAISLVFMAGIGLSLDLKRRRRRPPKNKMSPPSGENRFPESLRERKPRET